MKKKPKKETSLNKFWTFLRKNILFTGLVTLIVVLVVFSPYIFGYAQYGYYYLKCGEKPIIISDFFGPRTYILPSNKASYKVRPFSIYFTRYTCEIPVKVEKRNLNH